MVVVPGLQPHIAYEEVFEPRLVNRKTGAALLLAADEVTLLKAWDGSVSAARLSAAVSMAGADVEPWQVEVFFERLARLGCLAVPPPNIPGFSGPRAGVAALDDKVPRLRGDLAIEKARRSRAVFHVRDPKTGRCFSLSDVEVSVARMLDGRRTVRELVESADRLGIEVTLASLQHFLKQLKSYRFVDPELDDGKATWPKRTPWTEEERQLYQATMKKLRGGQYDEARSFVQSLESVDGKREEVQALKHRVEVEAEGIFELVGTFAALHAPPPAPAPVVAAPAVAPPGLPRVTGLQQLARLARARGRWLALAALGLSATGLLLRPVPMARVVACQLQLEPLGVPRTTRGGTVGAHDVELGARVQKGAVLARLGAGPSVDPLEERLSAVEQALAALPAAATGPKVEALRGDVKKLQGTVAVLEERRKAGARAQQLATERRLTERRRELDEKKRALEALTHEARRAPLEAELREVQLKKVALDATLNRSLIVAPVAGLFVSSGELPEQLPVNGAYGVIAGPYFKLVTDAPLPQGVVSAVFRSGEYEVEPAVVGGEVRFPVRQVFVGARGALEVSTGRAPWLVARFRRP
jgi:hypothetical protein